MNSFDSLPASAEWRVFLDVIPPESFQTIPQTLPSSTGRGESVSAQTVITGKNHVLDLRKFAAKPDPEHLAVCFYEFESESGFEKELAFSADWWMRVYLNGIRILDTWETGNIQEFFPAKLKVCEGKNILAVVVRSGTDGWAFTHGAVEDIRPPCPLEEYRAEWRELKEEALRNIERYRKGSAVLTLLDASGAPLAGADVRIRQKSHRFYFGCNALMLGQLDHELESRYESAFADLFNFATTTFCWNVIEPEAGKYRFAEGSPEIWRRPPPDRVLNFCRKHGIAMKGQPLLADSWFPPWAPRDPEKAKDAYRTYFKAVADRYGDSVAVWDVVNESFLCEKRSPDYPLYTPSLDYVPWAFRAVKDLFPKTALLEINEATPVNEGDAGERYFQMIRKMREEQLPVRSVGFQFHIFTNPNLRRHIAGEHLNGRRLLENYQKFCSLGLPLFISEITIPSTLLPGDAGEKLQAEVLDNLYHLWFSIPQMRGIIHWNFCDGAAWLNEGSVNGGLLDSQMRKKPAYDALYQLIQRKWKTHLDRTASPAGVVDFRGFFGAYEVTVKAGGREQVFSFDLKDSESNQIRLILK